MIHVRIIKTSKRELKAFLQLPFDIYRQDSNWVPPQRHDLTQTLLGKENEFFARGVQRMFLAYNNETPVARVLAGVDENASSRLAQRVGYISLFESYDNYEYAQAVLDASMRFLKEQRVRRVLGPFPPRFDLLNRGLLIEGFDAPPVMENAYNTPALPQMLEQYGFTKWRDYLAYDIPVDNIPIHRILPMAVRIRERFSFRTEQVDFSKNNLIRIAQDMSGVICEAAPDEPGEYLPTPEDLLMLFKRIRPWLRNETSVMAYAGNKPIGVVIGLLDSSPSLQGTDGRRTPWNLLRRKWKIHGTKTMRCPIQYVIPEYQNKAVNAVMLAQAVEGAKKLGICRVEGSLVDETHIVSINNTQTAGGKLYRKYRVYQINLS